MSIGTTCGALYFSISTILILSGAGDFYCSGNDLSNFMNIPPDGIEAMAIKAGDLLE